MSLFIKQIAENLSGQVAFSLPSSTGNGGITYREVVGFLSEDPVIKMGNKWESLIGDLGGLNDFMQLSKQGQVSWVSASKMAWKGTDPITVTLNFYLITYLKAQVDGTGTGVSAPISKQATYFAELASVGDGSAGDGSWLDNIKVSVHGGYKPNYWDVNGGIINNSNMFSLKDGYAQGDSDDGRGTCHIVINGNGMNSVVLKNMLLESIDFTPSTVRAGYWEGITDKGISQQATFKGSSEPLYIKINASFKLMHTATINDVQKLFGGRYS